MGEGDEIQLTEHEKATPDPQKTEPERPRFMPPNYRVSGYHWIRRFHGGPAIPLYWNALWQQSAGNGWGQWAQPDREDQWEYLGQCPSPDDKVTS